LFQKDIISFAVIKKEIKRTVKKARSVFVCYIILKLIQIEKKRKESNNQIPFDLKKKILKKYKDLKRVFQIDLTATVLLNKKRIHSIDLEKGKMSFFYPIYPLVTKELIVL